MKVKDIVKILDDYTTPNIRGVEYPYYKDVAKEIIDNIEDDKRIFTIEDMLNFAFYARSVTNDIDWIFLNENHVRDYQKEQVESKYQYIE